MENILNLTQHKATPEQVEAGVIDLTGRDSDSLKDLLTFKEMPTAEEIESRAEKITQLAENALYGQLGKCAMIGGALWLMSSLEIHLKMAGIKPVYAFSKRESMEKVIDGKTVKTNVFKHIGFVEA